MQILVIVDFGDLGFWRLLRWRCWQLMQADCSRWELWKGRRNHRNGWSCTESDGVSCYDPVSPLFGTPDGQEARCQPAHDGFCRTWYASSPFYGLLRVANLTPQSIWWLCLLLWCGYFSTFWSVDDLGIFTAGLYGRWDVILAKTLIFI